MITASIYVVWTEVKIQQPTMKVTNYKVTNSYVDNHHSSCHATNHIMLPATSKPTVKPISERKREKSSTSTQTKTNITPFLQLVKNTCCLFKNHFVQGLVQNFFHVCLSFSPFMGKCLLERNELQKMYFPSVRLIAEQSFPTM